MTSCSSPAAIPTLMRELKFRDELRSLEPRNVRTSSTLPLGPLPEELVVRELRDAVLMHRIPAALEKKGASDVGVARLVHELPHDDLGKLVGGPPPQEARQQLDSEELPPVVHGEHVVGQADVLLVQIPHGNIPGPGEPAPQSDLSSAAGGEGAYEG